MKTGLKENLNQFLLLVLVNAFVGGMVGLERSIFPRFAEDEFGVDSHSAILSFIVAFGISKAAANYFTGKLANRFGRKNLLTFGWVIALPVPLLLLWAQAWNTVVFANVLLGISQGFTWSSTVVMKIDLVGEKQRGLAMGINEFAGYLAVGLVAFLTGIIAHRYGITPYPFYLGLAIAIVGLLLSWWFVKDTVHHVQAEQITQDKPEMSKVFVETSFKNPTLSAITQAGLVNNLNDGMIWGLFPVLLANLFMDEAEIGLIVAIYPTVWGLGQLVTGKMGDLYSKKKLLVTGMAVQAPAILLLPFVDSFSLLALISVVLGLGTALVYPNFLSAIAEATSPIQRAESIGSFRLWRDLGYAIGAILSGVLADLFGLEVAIVSIGVLTALSAFVLQFRMTDT